MRLSWLRSVKLIPQPSRHYPRQHNKLPLPLHVGVSVRLPCMLVKRCTIKYKFSNPRRARIVGNLLLWITKRYLTVTPLFLCLLSPPLVSLSGCLASNLLIQILKTVRKNRLNRSQNKGLSNSAHLKHDGITFLSSTCAEFTLICYLLDDKQERQVCFVCAEVLYGDSDGIHIMCHLIVVFILSPFRSPSLCSLTPLSLSNPSAFVSLLSFRTY